MKDSASDWFVVNTSDFIEMWRHHKKYVEKVCDIVCPSDEPCELHKKLRDMTNYVEWLFIHLILTKKSVLVDKYY